MVNRHCYIKFRNEEDVNKCLFYPKHQFDSFLEIKVAGTYGIGENEESDRIIFIKITPRVQQSSENMEAQLNVRFP